MKGKMWKRILAFVLASIMIFGDSAIGFAMESQPKKVEATAEDVDLVAEASAEEDVDLVAETVAEEVAEVAIEKSSDSAVMTVAKSEAAVVDSGTCSDDWRVTWAYYEDGVLKIEGTGAMTEYSYSGYKSERPWQPYASEIKEVIIGDEITSISQYAFDGIESIENIVLGTNVAEIGRYAFGNTTPKSITLPNGDFTDMFAFPEYSYSPEVHDYFITVKIRADATAVSSTFLHHGDVEAFQVIEAADETASVNYASSDGVLYNADYSTLIAYPQRRQEKEYAAAKTTTMVESGAFYGSYYVEKVILPKGLETIEEGAFDYCEKLKEVNIPGTVTDIGVYAFRACYSLEEINIPDSVTAIGTGAFKYCESLETVIIGDGVEEIADIAFNSCIGIKRLKFGRNVISIREAAFSPIASGGVSEVSLIAATEDEPVELNDTEYLMIEEMLIPVKEVTVAEDSFGGVDARKVFLYSDTASGSDSVFLGFPGTETFEVIGLSKEGAEAKYAQRDGVLFDTEYKELVSYPKGRKDTEYRIADEISDIHTRAFYNADVLERLYIPNSVSFIGAEAFAECDHLTIYCDADSYAAQYAEENEIPYSTQENNIEFTLLKKYSVGRGEEQLFYNDQISEYDVVVTKDNIRVLGCKVYRENIVLPPAQVKAGDVLKIHLTSRMGETLDYTTEVTLDEKGYASTIFEVVQKGRFKVSPTGADVSSMILFDMDGKRLESVSCTTGNCISGCYDAGSYQVMVIYGEDNNWPFDTLKEFEENDYIGGVYTLKTIEITDNAVTDLGEVSVEKIDVMSAVYLDDASCYFANTDVVSQNGLIQVKAEYQFEKTVEEIIPKALRISIPENCAYVSGSMKIDGEFTEKVSETENEIIVLLEKLSGSIIFNLKPSDFGTIRSCAILEFETEKGELAASLGTIDVLAPYISLETGTKTTEEEITVSGVTIPETEIQLYDGPYKIGTARSSKSGRWSTTVKLVSAQNGSVHDIKAVINEGTEEERLSNTVNVLYEWSVEVVEFKVEYLWEGYHDSKWCEEDLLSKKLIKYPRLSFQPSAPVTFIVRLSDNDKAENVYIVNTKLGTEELIEAEYSKNEDCWVAKKSFRKSLPGALSVRVIEKKSEIIVDKNAEMIIDSSDVSDELKNAEYEEIVNDYNEETGIGDYEGKIMLADEAQSEIEIKVTGKELENDSVSKSQLLEDGYVKAESADKSSEYYMKMIELEDGDYEVKTVEFQYGISDGTAKVLDQSVIIGAGELVNRVIKETGTDLSGYYSKDVLKQLNIIEASEGIGNLVGDGIGLTADTMGYMEDFLGEDSIYNRINLAYEVLTDAYANNQISQKEYSKKLEELENINGWLLIYQLTKLTNMTVGVLASAALPGAGPILYSLVSCVVTDCAYKYFDSIFEGMFADFYNIQLRWIVDPSGYVYEAVSDNRLENVTATIYYQGQDDSGNISSVFWNAEEYDQLNPLITEAAGVYAWDVPEGYWKVVFEKDGYEAAETEWLPVPPMQTDINVGMISKELTVVDQVALYDEYAILLFNNFVQADSLTSETVKIYSSDRKECGFTVQAVDGAKQGQEFFASQYRLVFDKKLSAGAYDVEISKNIKDYADRNLLENYKFTDNVKSVVKEITAKIPEQIVMGKECTIPVTIVTEGNLNDYKVEFVSEAKNAFSVLEVLEADENGTYHVKIDPNLPVQAKLNVHVDGVKAEEIPLEILINEIPESEHAHELGEWKITKEATCTKSGEEQRSCEGCSYVETKEISVLGHSFTNYISDNNATTEYAGTLTAKCDRCDVTDTIPDPAGPIIPDIPLEPENDEVIRLSGATRYETGYKVANALKEKLNVNKFDAVIVATGKNFADALAGSYLSVVKDAPILLTNGKSDNIAQLHEYIKANVADGGTVYLLGGDAAVPKAVESIDGYTIKRLSGSTRYDTNIEILKEAGITGDTLIVATGKSFADSLSASATKLPILLVRPGKILDAEQKEILDGMNHIYIIGGTGAVSESYANELMAYGKVERVYGTSRYDTSIAVANTFFDNIDVAVVASGKNFPDGLCGGSLAATMNAPLILTADGKTTAAADYMQAKEIDAGYVLGGTGALGNPSVVDIFGLGSADEIIE